MAQARINEEGIKLRKEKISRWEAQIEVWRSSGEKSPGMDIMRQAVTAGKAAEEKEVLSRVKSLALSTEADRLDLAKHQGMLDAFNAIYYDIVDASKKIEGAENIIAKLVDEIKRAKKGELLDVGA
jgi:hypothetical protein